MTKIEKILEKILFKSFDMAQLNALNNALIDVGKSVGNLSGQFRDLKVPEFEN